MSNRTQHASYRAGQWYASQLVKALDVLLFAWRLRREEKTRKRRAA